MARKYITPDIQIHTAAPKVVNRYDRLKEIYPCQISAVCPVSLLKAAVLRDNNTQKFYLQTKWHSEAPDAIQTVHAVIAPCDMVGNPLNLDSVQMDFTNILYDEGNNFGSKTLVEVPTVFGSLLIREVNVILKDKSQHSYTFEDFVNVEAEKPLLPTLPENIRPIIEMDSRFRCLPSAQENGVTRCICGSLKFGEGVCPNCGLTMEQAYHAATPQALDEKYKRDAEKARQNQEQGKPSS